MATSRDKYYMKMYETLFEYNNRNNAPLPRKNTQDEILKVLEEEESDAHNITSDAHNITADTFS